VASQAEIGKDSPVSQIKVGVAAGMQDFSPILRRPRLRVVGIKKLKFGFVFFGETVTDDDDGFRPPGGWGGHQQ
jgi:hypothetical protein